MTAFLEHLPALQVAVPLLSAPLCVLARRGELARAVAGFAALLTLGISTQLLQRVLFTGPVSYQLGGWQPPWGIEYRIDALSGLVLFVVSAVGAVTIPLGPGEGSHDVPAERHALFYAAFLLCMTGLLGITITADAFNVFVFLEISSLSTYVLVGLGRSRRALRAAFSYLVLGTIGGTFVLIGIGFLYQMTGTLNMADLASRLPAVIDSRTVRVAFAFLTVGVAIKLAVFPLHQWLPSAYAEAPATVSAFVAGTATKVMYYLWLRLIFGIFGASFVFDALHLDALLVVGSLAAMFLGALAAIYQPDLRRLLAYSSISQIGYLTLALSLASTAGIRAGLIHLFNHALMKSGLFLVAASFIARVGTSRVDALAGLGRRMPVTATAFVIAGLGLIGVPGTAGFVSKWYLVTAALEQDRLGLAVAVLLSSLLAVAYVWRLVEVLFFRPAQATARPREAPLTLVLATSLLVGATLVFGFYTDLPFALADSAAVELLGGTP